MAVLSINKHRLGEGITKLSGDESEWDDPNSDIIFLTRLETVMIRKNSVSFMLKNVLFFV